MATGLHRGSAQIYDFAARRALKARGRATDAAVPPPRVECDGWYHEAAMREEAEARAARSETKPA